MHEFSADLTNPAQPVVVVDGQEQTGLTRVSVDFYPGAVLPQLYLTYGAGGQYIGTGDVVIRSAEPQAVLAWVDRIDPAALEAAALKAEEQAGRSMAPGEMFRAGLRALAEREVR